MKKKVLSILLTVAMLVAMVPAFTVAASAETGKVYEVSTPDDIYHFLYPTANCTCADKANCKYKDANAAGNTMKLMADLDYSTYTKVTPETVYLGYWTTSYTAEGATKATPVKMLAAVDGNGKTVKIPDGTYQYGAILCYLNNGSDHVFKNLNVVMASEDAVAKTNEIISLFGEHYNNNVAKSLTVENCNFDLNFEITGSGSNACAAVLLSRHRAGTATKITTKNCTFKMDAKVQSGAHGAIQGRRWAAVAVTGMVTYNIEGCTFDVSYDTSAAAEGAAIKCYSVIGQLYGDGGPTVSMFNATGTNTVVGELPVCDVEDIEFAPPTTDTPGENEGGDQTPGGDDQTPGGDDQTPGGNDQTPGGDDKTNETEAKTEAPTTTVPAEEESGCASVVGGAAVVMIAMAAAFVCKKKED